MKITLYENRKLLIDKNDITMNENNVTSIEIAIPEEYKDYNKKIVFLHNDEPIGWDKIEQDVYIVKKSITKYEKVKFYLWLTNNENDFRSETREMNFIINKDVNSEVKDEEIGIINNLLNQLEQEKNKVTSLKKDIEELINEIETKLVNGEFNYVITQSDKYEIINNINTSLNSSLSNYVNKSQLKEKTFEITYEDGTSETIRSVVFR